MAPKFQHQQSRKRGGLFHYTIMVLVVGWLLASVYFLYSSIHVPSLPNHAADSNNQQHSGKFEKLQKFVDIPNTFIDEGPNHERLSHKINCPSGKRTYIFSKMSYFVLQTSNRPTNTSQYSVYNVAKK